MSSHTRATYVWSSAPFGLLGVPTQISDTPVAATASHTSVVARKLPSATTSLTSSATPGSTTGLFPSLIMSTFKLLTSTPVTCQPAFAKQAAETHPTYPSPNTPSVFVMAVLRSHTESAATAHSGAASAHPPLRPRTS